MPVEDYFAVSCMSEGVPSALAAARDSIDALLRDRGLRRTTPELTTESLLRGAAASGLLEVAADGGVAGSTAACVLAAAVDRLGSGAAEPPLVAAARLNAGVLALVPVVRRSPLQALARLHVLAAAGSCSDDLLGRPRPDPEVARRLQRLSAQLVAPSRAPAIAVAALAHAEVATLAPFARDNALVGRALERLLLVARGVDPSSMVVPEAGHLALVPRYRSGLEAYAGGAAAGRREWLLYACAAVGEAVSASPLR